VTTVQDYPLIYLCVLAAMVACRVVPMFVLKGRTLPDRVEAAFSLIPVAAFAALVANDLIKPDLLVTDPVAGLIPFVAAVPVVFVARKTGSLIWSAVVAMGAYALLVTLV
jgi:branched-subunit amino acid transport protein